MAIGPNTFPRFFFFLGKRTNAEEPASRTEGSDLIAHGQRASRGGEVGGGRGGGRVVYTAHASHLYSWPDCERQKRKKKNPGFASLNVNRAANSSVNFRRERKTRPHIQASVVS